VFIYEIDIAYDRRSLPDHQFVAVAETRSFTTAFNGLGIAAKRHAVVNGLRTRLCDGWEAPRESAR
jgi:hypothetical protein